MDGSIGKGLGQVFGCLITSIIVLFIGCVGFGMYAFFRDDSIKSEHPIKPQIELVIKDNEIDTLYVYKKP